MNQNANINNCFSKSAERKPSANVKSARVGAKQGTATANAEAAIDNRCYAN